MAPLSRTSIDRLGDRLRHAPISQDDLRMLDEYRRSFGDAYEEVVHAIRSRLVQVQDIAGCRVVVQDIRQQDRVVAALKARFQNASVVDRRAHPSFGYRAVHVIVSIEGKPVEIQVRTGPQHLWAEFSERLSDTVDPAIKYGGGAEDTKTMLAEIARRIAQFEEIEVEAARIEATRTATPDHPVWAAIEADLVDLQAQMREARRFITEGLRNLIQAAAPTEPNK